MSPAESPASVATTEQPQTAHKAKGSLAGGTVIVTGTAVGAGMFSLPFVSSGMWFGWSLPVALLTWFCMLQVSLFILRVNLHYRAGASFSTFVSDILGVRWNLVNTALLGFVFYILLYAYISGGSSIVTLTLNQYFGWSSEPWMSGLLFTLVLGAVVWLSTSAVDRVTSVLLLAMLLTFILSMAELAPAARVEQILLSADKQWILYPFAFAALPFYLTSFGFQTSVPSLVKYYGHHPIKIRRSLWLGSLLVLGVYLVWLLLVFGQIPRPGFRALMEDGGNVGALVAALSGAVESDQLSRWLGGFANFALATSFLGVSLALFDFIADRFKWTDDRSGRLKTASLTYIPPLVMATAFPNGFIHAIGYAGLALSVAAIIIPALMILRCRRVKDFNIPVGRGSAAVAALVLLLGIFYILADLLTMLEFLPVYGR